MTRKATVVIEKDEHGFYAWCPELKGCQSQGATLEDAMANIKEAIEIYLETLPGDERDALLRLYLACSRRSGAIHLGVPLTPGSDWPSDSQYH